MNGRMVALTVIGLGVVACGSGSSTSQSLGAITANPTATPNVDIATLGQQFTALRNAGNADVLAERNRLSNTDIALDDQVFAAIAKTYDDFATKVLSLPFPASMEADAKDVASKASAVGALASQLSQSTSVADIVSGEPALSQADAALHASTLVLTHDLGLPPPTPLPA